MEDQYYDHLGRVIRPSSESNDEFPGESIGEHACVGSLTYLRFVV